MVYQAGFADGVARLVGLSGLRKSLTLVKLSASRSLAQRQCDPDGNARRARRHRTLNRKYAVTLRDSLTHVGDAVRVANEVGIKAATVIAHDERQLSVVTARGQLDAL